MVIYIGKNEEIRIQEINEEKDDLRIGVYYGLGKYEKLVKVFGESKEDLEKAILFGEEYLKHKEVE